MNLVRTAFKIHRVVSYVVFAQVLAWVVGGVVFAMLPFDSVIKGGAVVTKPTPVLAGDWRRALAEAAPAVDSVTKLEAFAGPTGAAIRVHGAGGPVVVRADGAPWSAPDSAAIARWAAELYRGGGGLARVERVDRDAPRAGIVRETGERGNLWRATFDDALHTRLYFDRTSGEFVMVRNDAWVLYDFFWRLHVMDYRHGEDFNNPLLRVFAATALVFALSGTVLTVAAMRRAVRGRKAG